MSPLDELAATVDLRRSIARMERTDTPPTPDHLEVRYNAATGVRTVRDRKSGRIVRKDVFGGIERR